MGIVLTPGVACALFDSMLDPLSQTLLQHPRHACRVAGLVVHCSASVVGVIVMLLVPQLLVTELSILAVGWNILFARLLLGRQPTRAICGGSVALLLLAAVQLNALPDVRALGAAELLGPDTLRLRLQRPDAVGLAVVFTIILLATLPCFWAVWWRSHVGSRRQTMQAMGATPDHPGGAFSCVPLRLLVWPGQDSAAHRGSLCRPRKRRARACAQRHVEVGALLHAVLGGSLPPIACKLLVLLMQHVHGHGGWDETRANTPLFVVLIVLAATSYVWWTVSVTFLLAALRNDATVLLIRQWRDVFVFASSGLVLGELYALQFSQLVRSLLALCGGALLTLGLFLHSPEASGWDRAGDVDRRATAGRISDKIRV